MFLANECSADDDVIGYSEHGIKITKKDIEVKSINVNTIRTWRWFEDREVLQLTLNQKKKVDVHFFNRCWDMPYATALQFKTFANSSFISKGDGIYPVAFTNRSLYPCTIQMITESIQE